jgi:HSP20 family protein
MALIRWQRPELGFGAWRSPFEELSRLRDEIDRLWGAPLADFTRSFGEWAPAIDVYEERDNLVVRAEVPGMKKEEIDVSLHGDTLTISGERKVEKKEEGETHRTERFVGRFSRSITLPTTVDGNQVKAHYQDGVLNITLPKSERAKPKQIEVNVK